MSKHAEFQLLERPIQNALWDLKWDALRPIQSEAIRKVIESEDDIIISARTASGKTEAAFLPVLSEIYRKPKSSVQAIYVGPLKALINNQFERLEYLCQRAEIPVHRWHGDVSQAQKKKLLNDPRGVLLITPESIESLFVNQTNRLSSLFCNLQFIVIDEIHALVGNERGTHLRSLLFRLQRVAKQQRFRMIGLSATLGEKALSVYKRWMRPDQDSPVSMIDDVGEQKTVKLKIYGYEKITPEVQDVGQSIDQQQRNEQPNYISDEIRDCYQHMYGRKNLVFANTRQTVESFADSLNYCCKDDGNQEQFLVHHGSLSKEIREQTEAEMQRPAPRTTVCSATLELGIDIGNVATVGQIGPTWSVNSLAQRLGRSGRGEGQAQCLRVYVIEDKCDEKTSIHNRLRTRLLQSIATTELLLKKRYENPFVAKCDFSTLTQQILSILAETGGTNAQEIYDQTIRNGAFRAISSDQLKELLRSLARFELIEQMVQGDLILAPKGEAIVQHYSFYSAFATPQEMIVLYDAEKIGMLPAIHVPRVGDHVLLGARRWQVVDIYEQEKTVLVKPAKGRKPPKFEGSFGEIATAVRQAMKRVLLTDVQYRYLNDGATKLLSEARKVATQSGLNTSDWLQTGASRCYWFNWTGTKIQRTLSLIANSMGLNVEDCEVALGFETGIDTARSTLQKAATRHFDPEQLARSFPAKEIRKYDSFLSPSLQNQAIAKDFLDVDGAIAKLKSI